MSSPEPEAKGRKAFKRRLKPLINEEEETESVAYDKENVVGTDVGHSFDSSPCTSSARTPPLFADELNDNKEALEPPEVTDDETEESSTLYNQIRRMTYAKAQKLLCASVERLTAANIALECQIRSLTQTKQCTLTPHERHSYPLYPGASQFTKRQPYRYLSWNPSGTLSVTRDSQHGNTSLNPLETTDDVVETVEIVSLVAGMGQRRQTKNNSSTRFNLGAIGTNGFALARGHCHQEFQRDRQHKTAVFSNYEEDQEEQRSLSDSDSVDSGEAAENENDSYLEYHPFATWGPIAKGWWSKKFGAPEVVESVSVGDTFVAVLTSLHYLRIYSLGGLNLHTVYLNGNPVALVSYKTSLLVVALRNAGTTHQEFLVKLFTVNPTIECVDTSFSLPLSSVLVWVGLTPRRVPIFVESSGRVFALLPTWKKYNSSLEALNWVPVLDLKDALTGYQASQLSSPTGSILSYFWIASCNDDELSVFRLSRRHSQPPLSPTLELLACPFRLPVVPDNSTSVLPYLEWVQQRAADPDLKDMERVASFTWDVFDEMRLRHTLLKAQIQCVMSLPFGDDAKTLSKSTARHSVQMDKVLFRIFMKALMDNRVERALETATFFTHPKTFQVALAQAENRGNKGLCERLYSEIERRIIQENSKQVREQLKELDATLTPSQVLYDPATSPAEPQFLSIAQQVRRDMAASSHNSPKKPRQA